MLLGFLRDVLPVRLLLGALENGGLAFLRTEGKAVSSWTFKR